MKSTLLSFRFLALVTLGLASVHVLPGASIQVNTTFALPAASSQPLIWPASVASLQARATDPLYSGYSNNVRSYVNGQLGSLASQTNEDTLASIAKGAAILERLGETPPNTYASYALVATTAISRMGSRAAWILFQPSNRFQHIYDSGRLQSMAEAFDLLRGSANLTATNISTMRSKITQWADAGRNNLELNTFHPDDNYALKFGSALVTTALALRDSSTANTWLTKGKTLVNAALNRMADETGWYRESSWYANYSLNNLVSTAHHVKNATGGSVNWFTNLKPLFTFALFTRQPDGSNTPSKKACAPISLRISCGVNTPAPRSGPSCAGPGTISRPVRSPATSRTTNTTPPRASSPWTTASLPRHRLFHHLLPEFGRCRNHSAS